MVENGQKHSKMSKKVPFSSCVQEAYERPTNKNEVLFYSFLNDFDGFDHAFAGRNTQQFRPSTLMFELNFEFLH